MIAWLLLEQITSLFLIMGSGFLIVKLKLLNPESSKTLSVLSIYIIMPCVMISAFQIDYTEEIRDGFLLALAAAVMIQVILLLLNAAFDRALRFCRIEKASLLYSNAGNLVIPIVYAILGPEWVIYASAFICVQMIMMWTHGQSIMQGKNAIILKSFFSNFNLIAIMLGLFLFVTQIKLPTVIAGSMNLVAPLSGPISMLMLGIALAKVQWKAVFTNGRTYIIAFLKMLLAPLVILLFLKYSGIASYAQNGETILFISLLAVITPTSTTIVQMAQLYDADAPYASAINVFTTVICIATMPLMVMLYYL